MSEQLFTTKITKLSASKTRAYPSLRLPKEYLHLVGDKAEIRPIDHEGKQAFLVVVDQECLNSESISPLETRVSSLEEQLKSLQKSISEECGGPDEIRTHDPRRVKAMS